MGSTQTKAPPRSATNAVGASTSTATSTTTKTRLPDQQLKIVFTGAGGSGKTTMLYALKLGEIITAFPTIGFNVEDIDLNKSTTMNIWDVGGGDKISPLVYHYTAESHGVVFFIPSFWQESSGGSCDWLQTFDPNRIETASHHNPEWVHQLRRHATMIGTPLMILVNEPSDTSKIHITKEDILKRFRLENIHERPTKVVTVAVDGGQGSSSVGLTCQMLEELMWFQEIECKYAAGESWVALPLSLFLPPIVRRTSNVLHRVEQFVGSNKIYGFVAGASERSVEAEWVVNQARDHYQLVCRGSGGSGGSGGGWGAGGIKHGTDRAAAHADWNQANYNRHDLSLEFQERLAVNYSSDDTFDNTEWYDTNVLGQGTHYDLLRMLYESIHRNGRKDALKMLFQGMNTSATSASASTTSIAWLPVTSTYFWLHMVDYFRQVVVLRLGKHQLSFRALCLECPFLSHSFLIYDYYTKEKMKGGVKEMVLPDLKPLPSMLPRGNKFQHGELK